MENTTTNVPGSFIQQLRSLGLGDELGWEQGGFYSPSDLEAVTQKYSDPRVLHPTLALLQEHGNQYSAHELLHCFDVGKGAAELAEKLQEFNTAKRGIGRVNNYFPLDPEDAFLAGVFHDLALAFKPSMFKDPALRLGLAELVKSEAQKAHFTEGVLYNKGPVEDDVFGAALLGRVGLGARKELGVAVISALPVEEQRGLAVPAIPLPMLQKVLDGLWYHDGNNPVRGFAEAPMLVGDRLALYDDGVIDVTVINQGLKKLLTYTEPEQGRPADDWMFRGKITDIFYLERMLEKKAPGFIGSVKGTPVYDFIVEDLARRQRGERSLRSPAFMKGFYVMHDVLKALEARPELSAQFAQQIHELYQRHESVQQQYLR